MCLILIEAWKTCSLKMISVKALWAGPILKAFLNFLKSLQQLYLLCTCDFSYHFLLIPPFQTRFEKLNQASLWSICQYFADSLALGNPIVLSRVPWTNHLYSY